MCGEKSNTRVSGGLDGVPAFPDLRDKGGRSRLYCNHFRGQLHLSCQPNQTTHGQTLDENLRRVRAEVDF